MNWTQVTKPGWRAAHLEDLVFFQRGFDITKAEQKTGDIPVVSSSGTNSYHSDSKADGPGVVIGRKGSLGTVHYVEGPYWPHDTTLWSKDLKGNHPRFVYYFLHTLGLERYDVGNSNPTLNRNHIHRLDIKIPEHQIQKRIASIKHVKREERPELPEEALREAVVNALVHRDYRSTGNVQIYIFKDRVEIVSPGGLPAGMTEADLGIKSIPRNPLLFGILHRMEAVEHIGSGIKRIRALCRDYGVTEPRIEVSEHWFMVCFPRPEMQEGSDQTEMQPESQAKSGPSQDQVEAQEAQAVAQEAQVLTGGLQIWEFSLLRVCVDQDATGAKLLEAASYSSRTGNFKRGLEKLLNLGLLEMTIPDKPRSSKQRYRLTEKGRALLNQLNKDVK